jgi:hypothetical protein
VVKKRANMATLKPPETKKFPNDSLESQVYAIVENLNEFLPIPNDRNRLGFNLYKYMKGEGDSPEIIVKNAKLNIVGISEEELAAKIKSGLESIKTSR